MEGDPHSPWRYGESFWGLTKGLWYSHTGWLFHREMSNRERFAPDLVGVERVCFQISAFRFELCLSSVLPYSTAGDRVVGHVRDGEQVGG